jgi:hypothetical protein
MYLIASGWNWLEKMTVNFVGTPISLKIRVEIMSAPCVGERVCRRECVWEKMCVGENGRGREWAWERMGVGEREIVRGVNV